MPNAYRPTDVTCTSELIYLKSSIGCAYIYLYPYPYVSINLSGTSLIRLNLGYDFVSQK